MPRLGVVRGELKEYTNVLMGRQLPPFDKGVSTLMEYASVALGRALEIQARIHAGELDGKIPKGSAWYHFRTGELRDYIELFKNAFELGSRRVTVERNQLDMEGSV